MSYLQLYIQLHQVTGGSSELLAATYSYTRLPEVTVSYLQLHTVTRRLQ